MNRNLLIVGNGAFAAIAYEVAEHMGCFEQIDYLYDGMEDAVGTLKDMGRLSAKYSYAIAAVENAQERMDLTKKLEEFCYRIPILVHPKSHVSKESSLLKGVIVQSMAVVQGGATLCNSVFVCAGSVVGSNCFVGDCCTLEFNSIVMPNTIIQMGTRLPAGTVARENYIAKNDQNARWVREHIAQFGREPSFF
ncbi:UDP-3-O-[3-hydroxymyristoyl] glucosamine N-acyltransferase [Clostridiales bacterium CHKCI001]|nr:UDP-3-O-[3-hydroxymyristoyl] glucosamine N-acyltransferase [Clostridiales bacterium CHKCI001]